MKNQTAPAFTVTTEKHNAINNPLKTYRVAAAIDADGNVLATHKSQFAGIAIEQVTKKADKVLAARAAAVVEVAAPVAKPTAETLILALFDQYHNAAGIITRSMLSVWETAVARHMAKKGVLVMHQDTDGSIYGFSKVSPADIAVVAPLAALLEQLAAAPAQAELAAAQAQVTRVASSRRAYSPEVLQQLQNAAAKRLATAEAAAAHDPSRPRYLAFLAEAKTK